MLFSDEEDSYLYHVVNGTGWESGLRVREIPSALWRIGTYGGVEFSGSAQTYSFIYSASRQPKEGEEIAVVEEFTTGEDQYLYFWADGVPKEPVLPKNSEIAVGSEHVLLLNLTEAEFPFFQHAAKALSDSTKTAQRVFSLTEAGRFLEELPKLAMVVALLMAGIVFWGCSCLLSVRGKTGRTNRKIIGINTVLAAASLCLMGYVLNAVDLPASMLPLENVFEWKYYRDEFSFLLDTLGKLKRTELLDAAAHEIGKSFWILGGSAFGLATVVCAEGAVGLV